MMINKESDYFGNILNGTNENLVHIKNDNEKKYISPQIKTYKSPNIKYMQRNISTEQFMKFESPWIL